MRDGLPFIAPSRCLRIRAASTGPTTTAAGGDRHALLRARCARRAWVRPAAADAVLAPPIMRRGMVAWAGGGGGDSSWRWPAFEWGNGHTVWWRSSPDMSVISCADRSASEQIDHHGLVTPLPYKRSRQRTCDETTWQEVAARWAAQQSNPFRAAVPAISPLPVASRRSLHTYFR